MALTCGSAWTAGDFYLRSGDRVVFYGDSITDQRLYTVLTEDFVVTRYPKLDVAFIHSGWGGDRVSGGGGGPIQVRLQRDVIAYRPTVMTIMLGMNDGQYRPETEETDKVFFDGYKNIVNTVRAALPNIRITAIEPSPYDDVTRAPMFPGGYNAVLEHFGKWIAAYAKDAKLDVADLNTGVVEMLTKAKSQQPDVAQKIIPDRVHPEIAGHLIMAEQLLKAWNAEPVVASVAIGIADDKLRVETSDHAKITGLAYGDRKSIEWTELDDALPLPFASWTQGNAAMALAIKSSDVAAALNAEPLRITGLSDHPYVLSIDGQTIGTFDSNALASGINLAVLDTPMTKQAKRVFDLTVQHTRIHNDKWRSLQVPLSEYNLPETKSAMDALDALDTTLIRKQHEAAQPQPHHFELAPAA